MGMREGADGGEMEEEEGGLMVEAWGGF